MAGETDMDRLLATLRIKLPGVDDDALKLELFNTIDEHFRKTNAWREIIETQLVEGTVEYPIVAPVDTVLVRVLEATYGGYPMAQQTGGLTASSQLGRLTGDTLFPDGDSSYIADEQVGSIPSNTFKYAIYYPTYVTIDVPPSAEAVGNPINIVAAITLSPKALMCDCGEWSVPEWMWERYFNDWLHGTLANCMSEAAKPYSNAKLAVYHAAEFRRAKSFAKQEADRGFVFDRPLWRYPQRGGWIS